MGMASSAMPPNPFGMLGLQSQVSGEMQASAQDAIYNAQMNAQRVRLSNFTQMADYSPPKPSDVAKTAASRVAVVETEDDRKDYEADKLLHEVYTRKEEMKADRERILAAYKKDEE